MNEPGNPTVTAHPDARISATNFGPIANGAVDLRPLTVFVGPSNTGKTYFAILVYALHRLLEGFSRLPYHLPSSLWHEANADVGENELHDVLEKLKNEGKPFRFSDLPGGCVT